jgi:hypothetical protein
MIGGLFAIIYVSETTTSVKSVITTQPPILRNYVREFRIFQKTFATLDFGLWEIWFYNCHI